ncbi:PTS transporter subunit EIIB [Fusibacter bizertensis]
MDNFLNKIQKGKGSKIISAENRSDTDLSEMAGGYCLAVGGKENIIEIDSCITRLRLTLKDISVVDEAACMQLGAAGLIKCSHDNIHIVVGILAELISEEMKKNICK